jgi:hypothetical protein
VVTFSLLTDGGLRSALAIYTDVARLASYHAAPVGAAGTDWCWDLVAGSSRLVSMEYIRIILIYKLSPLWALASEFPDENKI